jgi:hypothetical protein
MLSKLRSAFTRGTNRESAETVEQRRRHPRQAVSLEASIHPIDFISDIVIQNVSDEGFMAEADVELSVGQRLHLTLDDKAYEAGTVRWTEGQLFGAAFDAPLAGTGAPDELDCGTLEDHKPRKQRVLMQIPARLCLGRPPLPATVRNLSQSGMLLETDPGLQTGQHILVKLGNRAPLAGRIQWHEEGRIGIKSTEPIGILSLVYSSE